MIIRPGKKIVYAALFAVSAILSSCSSRGTDDTPEVIDPPGVDSDYGYNGYDIIGTESVYAYRQSSPFASELKECVLINTRSASCEVSKLPFIGDGTTQPTIDEVMDRVLVTHNWMGERFESVLRVAPPEVLTLFSSATAVLIGSDVRPSFYTTVNGAIQLDPVYLWTTVEEKGSISQEEDFRSGYGADLQFWWLASTRDKNGDRATPFFSFEDNSERTVDDTVLPLVRLLVHELVHATDYMPRSEIAGIDTSLSVYDAIDSVVSNWLSPELTFYYPLISSEMVNFAGVRYRGRDATAEQKAATAADVGQYMASDGAIKFYSYSSIREDLAQLVESVVMSYRYDVFFNTGFTQKPADEDNYSCNDLLVSWGQRNRLADPMVNVRARAATDLVLTMTPEMTAHMDTALGSPEQMETNVNWCANQTPSTAIAAESFTRSSTVPTTLKSGPQFREMMRADNAGEHEGFQQD